MGKKSTEVFSVFGQCEAVAAEMMIKEGKRTWLFYCGLTDPRQLHWDRNAGTHQVGWFDRIKPTLSKKDAMATPLAFRDELIGLAQRSA